ncbi:MAG: hypothetical protein AB7O26_08325, partial [Planctomycetaceae bacterium]
MRCAARFVAFGCFAVLHIVNSAAAQAPAEALRPDASPNAAGDASLTYDGKPFEFWHKQFVTELKPELRQKPLEALIVFGANGYADRVAPALATLLDSFDETDTERLGPFMEQVATMNTGAMG